MDNDHILSKYYDWIAAGAVPTHSDLDEIVGRLIGPGSTMDETLLRRELIAVQREIAAELRTGNTGRARAVARESSATLAAALGPLPRVDHYKGKTVREIVDGIPR